ncbi:MAG: pyridoxal-phosphate dependent enzyme [Candidatus Hodarchaeota archaeon]
MNDSNDPQNVSLSNRNLSLIDGATPDSPDILVDTERQIQIASSPEFSIEERLEAYEDIFESQVGDTTMTRARNSERETGLRQIYMKFEGSNPTGTQKDRIAFAQGMDALRRGFDAMTVATCGNYGVAIALASYMAGLKCFIFIPADYQTKRIDEIRNFGADIVRTQSDYEQAVQLSQKYAEENEIYDANPGGENTALQLMAYGEIAYEIYDDLRDAPTAVAVPVSNGTTLAGLYKGFISLYRRGKTSHIPKIIAGSSYRKNPIIQAYLKNLPSCEDLPAEDIRETKINEPLINWHSIDGDHALYAIRQTGGFAGYVSDRNMTSLSRMVREQEGLNVLPASTAGLAVLLNRFREQGLEPGRYVVILTGRK